MGLLVGGLDDSFLYEVVDMLGCNYHQLGARLGVLLPTIQKLERDYPHTDRLIFEILYKWRRKWSTTHDPMGMVHMLTTALCEIGQNLVADQIKQGECFYE